MVFFGLSLYSTASKWALDTFLSFSLVFHIQGISTTKYRQKCPKYSLHHLLEVVFFAIILVEQKVPPLHFTTNYTKQHGHTAAYPITQTPSISKWTKIAIQIIVCPPNTLKLFRARGQFQAWILDLQRPMFQPLIARCSSLSITTSSQQGKSR
ncbi:hypothetical protein BJ875DRAFT_243257 [Amylocarpus encephaloides]|uniref:Uncharacterized protein n=1 Tax=Amylocarpus encephaloides TaxID=45428 RepID=A0A9P7YT13_9HELO|nr:hypothetical protein BJ875DRAFT_243257 [Amylocarpus encephaloides]